MRIAVIGAGISGLSIANLLKEKHEVVLLEKDTQAGGLVKCERVNDCLFHKVGGHVFNSKNNEVSEWFWSYFDRDKEFVSTRRNAKVFFNNSIIGYPIENYIYMLEPEVVREIVVELLQLQQLPTRGPLEYENFESFLLNNFGKTLYKIYFKPYNEKIWRTDLATVSMQWLEGKLPMPNLEEIVYSNIVRKEEDGMVHSYFYYPKEGGSQFIVERLRTGLDIRTNQLVNQLHKDGNKILVNSVPFDKVVYCGDIRNLPQYGKDFLKNAGVDVPYLEELRSNGTSNLFCETDDNSISWLYIPQNFTRAHRIIYTGNFSDTNNRGSKRKTCVVEFSGKVAYEDMVEEVLKLPGNLVPLAHNYEEKSYVIQDNKTRAEINAAKKVLEKENIFLLGRFAEWEYYNMDKAIEAAFNLAKMIG